MLYESIVTYLLYFTTQISEMPKLFEISMKNIFIFIAHVSVICVLFINVQSALRRSGDGEIATNMWLNNYSRLQSTCQYIDT